MENLIYILEDDQDIAHLLEIVLRKQNYQVEHFETGEDLLQALEKQVPQLMLLDIMLPGISGIDVLKKIRSNSHYDDISIIMVTAKNLLSDKIEGLDLGADDYISKPFDIMELVSRVNARFRRLHQVSAIDYGPLSIDIDHRLVKLNNQEVVLTNKEFDILLLLVEAKGKVVSRKEILKDIWKSDAALETRTIDMHVQSLRKKLSDREGKLITTVFGVGYKIVI
ncbi:MAG: response regulator transcription factor [Bacilli bacterium]|jgi:two-component system alkaline phosphatase synthesis response regulator PhoP